MPFGNWLVGERARTVKVSEFPNAQCLWAARNKLLVQGSSILYQESVFYFDKELCSLGPLLGTMLWNQNPNQLLPIPQCLP